jgi:hypothetical protein
MWLARWIGKPRFDISLGEQKITWVNSLRYLEYIISYKVGWSKIIATYQRKTRQRIETLRSYRMYGTSSILFKGVLFTSYVRPLFTWLFCIFPLFTEYQKDDLGHYYFICLKRTLGILYWNDLLFSSLHEENSLKILCNRYWKKYGRVLSNSSDDIYRSKRLVPNVTTLPLIHFFSVLYWTYFYFSLLFCSRQLLHLLYLFLIINNRLLRV